MQATEDSLFGNIWKPYGLSGSPFFQEELDADPASEHPADPLFVGREAELQQIGRRIGGGDLTRSIIQGEPGVGKTTFVNQLKSKLARTGRYAVHGEPVRITTTSTSETFLADVLRVLIRIYNEGGGPRDDFWEEAGYQVEGGHLKSGGISVAGAGVSYQAQRIAPEVAHPSLVGTIREALDRIHKEYDKAVVLHVNNFENLAAEEAEQAGRLIQDVRDVFLQPGAHWLIVGDEEIEHSVFRHVSQVGSIFSRSVHLSPLTSSEVAELIKRRFQHLQLPEASFTPPIRPSQAAQLFELYEGDLRNFLRLLDDAATKMLGVEGLDPMTAQQVLRSMSAEYRREISDLVGEADFAYLQTISRKSGDEPFRVTDVAEWVDVTQPGASGIVARLVDAGIIHEDRREGRSVFYGLSGSARVALVDAINGDTD